MSCKQEVCYNRGMKTCNTCSRELPLTDFQKCARNKDGHTGKCKPCKREYDNSHYKTHPNRRAEIRASSDKNRLRNTEWLRKYLQQNPCIDCDEDDIIVLQFDHVRDKSRNISTMLGLSLSSIKKEVSKCEVRCANCHQRKTAKDFGWWRTLDA